MKNHKFDCSIRRVLGLCTNAPHFPSNFDSQIHKPYTTIQARITGIKSSF